MLLNTIFSPSLQCAQEGLADGLGISGNGKEDVVALDLDDGLVQHLCLGDTIAVKVAELGGQPGIDGSLHRLLLGNIGELNEQDLLSTHVGGGAVEKGALIIAGCKTVEPLDHLIVTGGHNACVCRTGNGGRDILEGGSADLAGAKVHGDPYHKQHDHKPLDDFKKGNLN